MMNMFSFVVLEAPNISEFRLGLLQSQLEGIFTTLFPATSFGASIIMAFSMAARSCTAAAVAAYSSVVFAKSDENKPTVAVVGSRSVSSMAW